MSETVVRPRLLIVESDESVRRALVRALAPRYEVTPLATGVSALGRLKEERFDVVLLDIALRDMAAVDLLRQMWAMAEKPPVIVTVPSPDPRRDTAVNELGVVAIVAKPFDRTTLHGALDRAIALARTR